jgi:predicted enzyme related to lactoylglutathione lyase
MKVTISIDVSNLDIAETFYVQALGCTLTRAQKNGMSVVSVENCAIYLQLKGEGSKATPSGDITRNYQRHWTPVHLDFLTEDVDSVVKKILQLGGQHEGGERGDWGAIAYCVDPFGNGFCVLHEKLV